MGTVAFAIVLLLFPLISIAASLKLIAHILLDTGKGEA